MADIQWTPDGRETFDSLLAVVPEGMRAGIEPKLREMLAAKAAGKSVDAGFVRQWVDEDLPEPQRSALLAAIDSKKSAPKAAPAKKAAWKVTTKIGTPKDLDALAAKGQALLAPDGLRITVSAASCGLAKGADQVLAALQAALKQQKVKADLVVVGGSGMAFAEPVVNVIAAGKPRVMYGNVTAERAADIVAAAAGNTVVEDLALLRCDTFEPAESGVKIAYKQGALDAPYKKLKECSKDDFFAAQTRLVTRNCGTVSPERIDEYVAAGGYQAVRKALTGMKPADVVKEVKASKLRGRGGAGFPPGIKWEAAAKEAADQKYIVCNGSEGDPEIGMHRSYLESDPHQLIEGMILGGYAIGASKGYIYLNDRYLVAIARVQEAIDQASAAGLLGDNIMGSGFSFDLQVKRGGGAYVCGEETALLNSLEGSYPEPRPRPPLPVVKGLFGKPTVVNNLETLSNIALIVRNGGKWFSGIGTPSSKGTKIIALSGNVARPCWVEVAMGTKIGDIISDFGGGTASGKKVKAFQTGGPSGGILPAKNLTTKLDYDALGKLGTLLGSGGLLVMDEDCDVVAMAQFLTDFFADESCGKCTPCREGVKQLQEIVAAFVDGRGTKDQVALIERMGTAMSDACFCALGKTAAAPILSVIKHFPADLNKRMLKTLN